MSEFKIATSKLIEALGSYRGGQLTKLLHGWEQVFPERSVADCVINFLQENVLRSKSVIGDDSLMPIIKDILDMSNNPVVIELTEEVEETDTEVEPPQKFDLWYP